jgi:hypothetical protein
MCSRIYHRVSITAMQYGVSLLCPRFVFPLLRYAIRNPDANIFPLMPSMNSLRGICEGLLLVVVALAKPDNRIIDE